MCWHRCQQRSRPSPKWEWIQVGFAAAVAAAAACEAAAVADQWPLVEGSYRPTFSSSCTAKCPGMRTACSAGVVAAAAVAVAEAFAVAVLGTPCCHPGHIPEPLPVGRLPEQTLVLGKSVVVVVAVAAGRDIRWAERDQENPRTVVAAVVAAGSVAVGPSGWTMTMICS